jgi:hypothetical protein
MTESHLDALLDELVPAEPREGWNDVVHRARRDQRRYTAVILAIATLVLASCSWVAVRAFEGTPAPPPVRKTFEFSNQASAAFAKRIGRKFPQAEVDKAHGVVQVQTEDGPLDLWAAPATRGRSCFVVGAESDMVANRPFGSSSGCVPHRPPAIGAGTYQGSDHPYAVVFGYATGSATAEVKLWSGRTVTLPVVEHYFLGELPIGSAVESVTGRDASGKIVARYKPPQYRGG